MAKSSILVHPPIDRAPLEKSAFKKLDNLGQQHLAELLEIAGNPPDLSRVNETFWMKVEDDVNRSIAVALAIIFLSSFDSYGGDGSPEIEAEVFANSRALWLAQRYVQTSKSRFANIAGKAAAGQIQTQDELRQAMSHIFGEGRSSAIAITETTRAITGGMVQAVRRKDAYQAGRLGLFWRLGETELHCPFCLKVADTESVVWRRFTDGPPCHIRCACFIEAVPMSGRSSIFGGFSGTADIDFGEIMDAAEESGVFESSFAMPDRFLVEAFCPTGKDGGIDNSCSSRDGGDSESPADRSKRVERWNSKADWVESKTGLDSLDLADRMDKAGIGSGPEHDAAQLEFMEKLVSEWGDKPHAWEPEDSSHPDQFERTTYPGEPEEKKQERREFWKARWELRQKFRDTLASAKLPNEKRREYLTTLQKTLDHMPVKAIQEATKNIDGVKWYPNTSELTESYPGKEHAGKIGGAWFGTVNSGKGELHLDGGLLGLKSRDIYAHELGHTVDWFDGRPPIKTETGEIHLPGHAISDTHDWRQAFERELSNKQLSNYASTHRSEAFAEFCRHAWSGVRPRDVEESFPLSYSVLVEYGLAHPVKRKSETQSGKAA